MVMSTTETRQKVHSLVDQLPAAQLTAVRSLLESMVDPVVQAIAQAPMDDEPFTEEDRRAVDEADEWCKNNQPIPLEAVLADFGLSMDDWEQMGKTPLPEERG